MSHPRSFALAVEISSLRSRGQVFRNNFYMFSKLHLSAACIGACNTVPGFKPRKLLHVRPLSSPLSLRLKLKLIFRERNFILQAYNPRQCTFPKLLVCVSWQGEPTVFWKQADVSRIALLLPCSRNFDCHMCRKT